MVDTWWWDETCAEQCVIPVKYDSRLVKFWFLLWRQPNLLIRQPLHQFWSQLVIILSILLLFFFGYLWQRLLCFLICQRGFRLIWCFLERRLIANHLCRQFKLKIVVFICNHCDGDLVCLLEVFRLKTSQNSLRQGIILNWVCDFCLLIRLILNRHSQGSLLNFVGNQFWKSTFCFRFCDLNFFF